MRVIEGIEALGASPAEDPSVVTVGVFDGVHLGHQRLLHELLEMASELHAVPTVVTFRDHPDRLLLGTAPPLLVSVPHRLRLLRRIGVQNVLLLDFDQNLRALKAEPFADRVLVTGLRAKGVLVGFDSALGKDREGTSDLLEGLGRRLGFVVRRGTPMLLDGEPISSTAIREAIGAGALEQARMLLGRWPSTFGEVVRGEGRGRSLGFATANLTELGGVLPPSGVYAVEALLDGEQHLGVANLGVRPTLAPALPRPRLEVHLFDWSKDLYGRRLEVCFVKRLREERRFAGPEALAAQIHADVAAARAVLQR